MNQQANFHAPLTATRLNPDISTLSGAKTAGKADYMCWTGNAEFLSSKKQPTAGSKSRKDSQKHGSANEGMCDLDIP